MKAVRLDIPLADPFVSSDVLCAALPSLAVSGGRKHAGQKAVAGSWRSTDMALTQPVWSGGGARYAVGDSREELGVAHDAPGTYVVKLFDRMSGRQIVDGQELE